MEISQEIKRLVCTIRNLYGDAAVAGGCVRDFVHNRTKKDVDIVVPYEPKKACLDFHGLVEELGEAYTSVALFTNYEEVVDPRLRAVVKISDNELGDVDIVFWNKFSVPEIVSAFDCNLNKYYIDALGKVNDSLVHPVGSLVFNPNYKLKQERVIKLCRIAQEIGWKI